MAGPCQMSSWGYCIFCCESSQGNAALQCRPLNAPQAAPPEQCLLPAVNVRMGKSAKYLAAAMAVTVAAGCPGYAQTTDSKACTEQERSNQTLSEKLGQTNGVICPPDIDAGMKAPTPEGGKTPVIPPPGSPGGNPNVQPK